MVIETVLENIDQAAGIATKDTKSYSGPTRNSDEYSNPKGTKFTFESGMTPIFQITSTPHFSGWPFCSTISLENPGHSVMLANTSFKKYLDPRTNDQTENKTDNNANSE